MIANIAQWGAIMGGFAAVMTKKKALAAWLVLCS